MLSSISSMFRRTPLEGESEENPLELKAVPGLMTILDVALFRSVEAETAPTIASSNALLQAWLDTKRQAQLLLSILSQDQSHTSKTAESFARACLESSLDALEKMSTDPLSASANLSDPYDPSSSGSSTTTTPAGIPNVLQGITTSQSDTGRRQSTQRPLDCWETARLLCPDHCWAEETFQACQRHVRHLSKHPFMNMSSSSLLNEEEARLVESLQILVNYDLPMRLHHFRAAMELTSVITKRLYLVKCEYRAPFRAFLEAHQAVQRAPSLELVQDFQQLQTNYNKLQRKRAQAENNLQSLLDTPELVEALLLEQECEGMEVSMGEALFPFSELARILDHRRARIKPIRGILDQDDVGVLLETLRRLKYVLCRKTGPEMSSGIRPILLDLQGVPRDETPSDSSIGSIPSEGTNDEDESFAAINGRLKEFIRQLQILGKLSLKRGAFENDSKRGEVDLPSDIVKSCSGFDHELFAAHFEDWYDLCKSQRQLVGDFKDLSEQIRRAELEVSISRASEASLGVVRQRLELICSDRQKRFEVLSEMLQEVCLREMNLHVKLVAPKKHQMLELPRTSAVGVFGTQLQMAHEKLPIG